MDQEKDSMLKICQLTELKQTKEWERYLNQFWHLYEIFRWEMCESMVGNGQQAK